MKSEWKVASNYFGGDKPFYQVYRKIDVDAKIDHSGNREYAKGVFADKVAAQAFADDLNAKAFYTVEIKPDLKKLQVVQCRGYRNNDRSPEEREEVNAFLAKYERWYNARPLGDHVPQLAQEAAAAV